MLPSSHLRCQNKINKVNMVNLYGELIWSNPFLTFRQLICDTNFLTTIFSKNALEKPHLEYTYNVRYFVALLSDLINPQFSVDFVTFTVEIFNGKLHFLCSDIKTSVLVYMKVDHFFQTLKMSTPPLLTVKNNRSPPLPIHINVGRVGSRNVSCSASKPEKLNSTLNIRGRGRKSKIL